jgi:hypothetical protein
MSPFQKGNKLATVNKGIPKNQAWENVAGWLVGEGGQKYKESLQSLASDKEISKPRKEFLEHYENLLEFHQPKLARQVDKNNNDVPKIEFVIKTREK